MVTQDQAIHGLLGLDFQNPNMWEFQFLSSAGTEGGDVDLSIFETYRVVSTNIPFHKFESHTRKTGSKHYEDWTPEDDFSITFLETTDFKVLTTLNNWKEQIYDTQERVFNTGDVRKFGLLTFNDNAFQESLFITFYRMLFKGFNGLDLGYTAADALTITANFTCDYITIAKA
jgi:hypothetical protein